MLNNYRSRLLTSTLLVSAALAAQPALAQSTDAAPPAAGADTAAPAAAPAGGDIVVTGSLIRNPNLVSSAPVAVVGSEEIALRQRNTAEELLRDLPGAAPSIGSAVNNGNNGASYVDLRGLGNFRNVVLLDGTRIAPSSTVGRTDLNNIPLALIERVETLTGGAATTYGADAVSGVVNFITRQDFSGVQVDVSHGVTQRGDGASTRADVTIGASFDDGKGNAVLSIGYQRTKPIYQGDRVIGSNNYTSTTGARGGSGTTVPARFTLPSSYYVQDSTVSGGTTPGLRTYSSSRDGFNFNPYNIYQTPFKRFNMYAAAHYDVSDKLSFYTRGLFSKNTVNTIIAPSGVFGQLLTIPLNSPYLNTSLRNAFCANNDFDPNTVGIQTLTTAQCAAGSNPALRPGDPNFRAFTVTVGRRTTEVGPRLSEYNTNIFDYRAGAKIDITSSINLDLSGGYGESENRQTQSNYVLISRLRTAVYTTSTTSCNLGSSPAVLNPANGLTLAATGAGVTAGPGCVPVNIFGPEGSITPNQVPYLTAAAQTSQKTSLAQARALLSGDFGYSLPSAAAPISFAAGAEYRRYTAQQYADVLSQTAGELGGAGGAVPNYKGAYDVKEFYGEVIAPILADVPGFKSLTLEGGLRYSAYSVDAPGNPKYNTTTYKGAATWEPIDGIKLRGNYQRAVRAPNIAELFAPINTGLTTLSTDPCASTRPVNNANLRAVCIAQGAPASTIGAIANPTSAQANATTAGGTYLRPEKSDSYTLGVVLQPRNYVPGLSITVDYYHIKIRNAISQPTTGDLINGCFGNSTGGGVTASSVSNPICALFRRNPVTGGLDGDPATTQGLLIASSNSGKILTYGIDLGINYRRDLGFAKLNASFQGNWTGASKFQGIVPGSVIPPGYPGAGSALPVSVNRECLGYYSGNCGSPGSAGPSSTPGSLQPEFSWNQRTTLTFGAIDFSLLWRHIGKMNVEPGKKVFTGTIATGALAGQKVHFGHINPYDYFDLAARIALGDHYDLTLTATNIFDKKPPIVGGTVGSTAFNSGNTYPSTYDALGRRFNIAASFKF